MNVRVVSHRDLVAAQIIEETLDHVEGAGMRVLDALRAAGYDVRHPDDTSRPPQRPPIGR